ncbi:MAG TPA: acetate--CoA ligase [Aggregatilineales bacterium]|nr:acetate--CoA ligase [Aggregatilineales bacterium]HPV08504.1 acetate--CoA ligase [Aggregatilineales bacterium]HQA68486.1 acetate--CoA ligase [Aggregatilineales bacterium]HQE17206.1 acetate--CoA ligase [Aggregatilineales bacterium]
MATDVDRKRAEEIIQVEHEVYAPPEEILRRAHISREDYERYRQQGEQDPVAFWEERARELVEWYEPWEQVLDESEAPFYKWFVGAKTNIVHNALDRHVLTWRKNKIALIWEGETGEVRTFSYFRLKQEVDRFANVLRGMGVRKGDRVTIYMGRIPELPIAMLACAKIGAVHSVVYGGFSVEALAERIEDAQSKVLITADGGYMRGKIVPLKNTVDEAVARSPVVETVIVVQRTGHEVNMEVGRDFWYHELAKLPIANGGSPTEVMDAEDPLYILYTSGTTGKPKGVLHTHGGYQVGIAATLKWAFDIDDEDRWWCAADPGWVTGHSYIVYGPLILGATSFMYEGAPDYPYPDRWWRMVEHYGITILYTAPTAIRGLMRFGDAWAQRHDLSSLRILGSVGEPINPEAWRWYHRVIGQGRCPIIDTWWQTETGAFMITPLPVTDLKPGSATNPFPGIIADVVDENGNPCGPNEDGYLVIKRPWPAMLRTIYGDPDRYVEQYWSRYADKGYYLAGDSARRDEDGNFWIIGRIDDVIKVAGYRLGTAEIESALVSHHAVAEAAVIGIPDEVKGNVIYAYVILREGLDLDLNPEDPQGDLIARLKQHVRHEMGPIAVPAHIEIVESLPKTRSGKIMRRVLRARALGEEVGDISTLEQ